MHVFCISSEYAEPPNSTQSTNSNSLTQIQIKLKSQFKSVPRDTEKSDSLEWVDVVVDFGDVAFLVETVI